MGKETRRFIVIMGIGLFSAIIMVFTANLVFFENLEHKFIDFKFSVRGPDYESLENSSIVIVAIDDQSFASIPYKYPWPRTYHAKLVENLRRGGAATILFDVAFTEESSINPEQDRIFADVLSRKNDVVLAGKMIVEEREGYFLQSLLPPIKKLREVAQFGIADTKFDSDGFVRRYILFRDFNGERYFSLGLATLINYLGLKGDYNMWFQEDKNGDYILGGSLFIKKYDDLPSTFIPYYGPAYSFKTISFEQVVDEEGFQLLNEREVFKDKIVLVGATVSELHDLFSTPFYVTGNETLMPGVEIHANFIQSILDQKYFTSVRGWVSYMITFIFALVIAFIIKRTRPLIGIVTAVLIAAAYFFINIVLFTKFSILMSFITPMGGVALAFVGCNAYQYFSEEKEKIYIRSVFKHYLAENVVDSILQDADALKFGGERRHLTVLFSDIRSFTTYSEKYTPEEVVSNLGEYLTEMVDVILKFGGMLDKFVGDEIMAVFGAPYYMGDHAEKACLTALEMVRSLDRLKEKWSEQGKESFEIGIGINTGDMIVGNLGSKQIFDYTVIGDNVNLGARLEGINKVYKTANNIIISEFTRNELSDNLVTRELDSVRVKGKLKPVAIFELVGEKGVIVYSDEFLSHYAEGLRLYKNQQWDGAIEEFRKALMLTEDEICSMYLKRCRHFKKYPPGTEWDGVFTLQAK
ncbi:MAG: CHASE2 domain-containing protein [Spirochaetota bacterium]